MENLNKNVVVIYTDRDLNEKRTLKGKVVGDEEFLLFIEDWFDNTFGIPKTDIIKVKYVGGRK